MRSSDLVMNADHDPYTCDQPSCEMVRDALTLTRALITRIPTHGVLGLFCGGGYPQGH